MQSILTQLNDGSGSSTSPVAGGFITKEIFDTRVPSKEAPGKTGEREDRGSLSSKQETSPDPFMSKRPAPPQFQGKIIGLFSVLVLVKIWLAKNMQNSVNNTENIPPVLSKEEINASEK